MPRVSEQESVYAAPRLRVDPLLWLIPLILSGLGILMVTSTTSPTSFEASGTPFTMGMRQLNWLGVGIVTMFLTYCIPTRFWFKSGGFLWLISMVMLVMTMIPGVGTSVGGAHRWLRVAGISIQPSEILTLSIVFLMAKLAVKNERTPEKCFFSIIILLLASALPLMLQPDLGSTILTLLICMGIYVERFGWKLPLITGGVGAALISVFILIAPYRLRRVRAFLNPWLDPLDTGFQTIQGLIAFANGSAWGSGLGHGFQKLNYLPAAYTDFIYAALGEELGLLGTLGVLSLCVMWMSRCRVLYNKVPEGYETAVVWGITLTIVLPCFINIAGVTNLMPLTGMPLPFLSYGGSALVMTWMRVGVLLRMHKEAEAAA
jgi:cell division protein FtsW